jgi:hypothetical protein
MSRLTLAGLCALAAPAVLAQVQPPIEDVVIQGEILNRSVGAAAAAQAGRGAASGDEIDGEAGVYVLLVNDIFSFSASTGIGHSANPTRTAIDAGGDWYNDLGASIGVATRLGGKVDFGAGLNLDSRDFFDTRAASSRSVSTTLVFGAPVAGPGYGSVIAFAGYAFDRGLHHDTGFRGLAANASASFRVSGNLLLRPGVGLTQQWSDVSENNSFTATASVDAIYAFSPKWLLSGRVSYSDRSYEDFYEDVTFVARDDTTFGASAALVWRPGRAFTVSASLAYEEQDSTFFLSDYDAFDTSVSLSFTRSF